MFMILLNHESAEIQFYHEVFWNDNFTLSFGFTDFKLVLGRRTLLFGDYYA